jgi:hypothetical protein
LERLARLERLKRFERLELSERSEKPAAVQMADFRSQIPFKGHEVKQIAALEFAICDLRFRAQRERNA